MSDVIFKKCSYDYKMLKPVLFDLADAAGGHMIKRQTRVIIKPNLLLPAHPDRAILTHPLLVRAMAEYVLEKGAHPTISDSPAVGSFSRISKEGGYKTALAGLDVDWKPFKAFEPVDIGEPFGRINMASDAVHADMVINMPKLKTHAQMLLTLGVKNLFGCIVGIQKPEWHFRTGVDREMFARLLVQIHQKIAPAITIVDGILALEGQGPGKGGSPRHIGLLVGGNHAPAIDLAICNMLRLNPDKLLTHQAAIKLGHVSSHVNIKGDFFYIDHFQFPELGPLTFGPPMFHNFMRKHLVQRPWVNLKECKSCGECETYCPADAITMSKKKLAFDYENCIRCYCCFEVCPHGALRAKETITGRMLRRIPGLKR
jgi:uncharacterized protein (DUF362 family)/Pyruvate/2-oxoacid:ferredoxin oxidoreductase delta subunit